MEVRIYDKNGEVIAIDKSTEGNNTPGHYDFELGDERTGIQFVKRDFQENQKEKKPE